MEKSTELMKKIIEKCEIQLEGLTISKERLMELFVSFLQQTIEKRKHNVGIVLHTGSMCFDVILILQAIVTNIAANESDTTEMITSIQVGDVVLYGQKKKQRYIFKGIIEGKALGGTCGEGRYIELSQNKNNEQRYVGEKSWHLIEPYNGKSTQLDGRGIRKMETLRDDFFVEVLNYEREKIPSILDTSSVIVLSRDKANFLMKNIGIKFGTKTIRLLELVTASYFTEEDEYCYGGNTGKNEPALKLTGKISVARRLVNSRKGNFHLGIIVIGKDIISNGLSELPEIINKKSLQYVYLCSQMDTDYAIDFMKDNDEIECFICSDNFLLENTLPGTCCENKYTTELEKQISTIIEKDVEKVNAILNNILKT